MRKVAVVTDSTAYMPGELKKDLPVYTVPLHLVIGKEMFLDGVTIQPDEFYTLQQESNVVPTTSLPSPEEFKEQFSKLTAMGYDIICIVISSGMSGTYNSAEQARLAMPEANITVVDSRLTSMGLGFPVIKVAQAARDGASLQECTALAEKACSQSGAIFTVSTLKYLHLGGRINSASAFLGTALNLKPILELRDGKIEAMERVRTFSKALDRLVDILVERSAEHSTIRLGYLLAKTMEEAKVLDQKIHSKVDPHKIIETVFADISPVIGAHTGPGTLGLAYSFDL